MSGLSKNKTVPTQGIARLASFLYSRTQIINCVAPRTSVRQKLTYESSWRLHSQYHMVCCYKWHYILASILGQVWGN